MAPAGRPSGAFRTRRRKILSRVSCANAESASTVDDVFIFPEQWKYIEIRALSQAWPNPTELVAKIGIGLVFWDASAIRTLLRETSSPI